MKKNKTYRAVERLTRVDDRFIDKVKKWKKGTDMDIEKHERRLGKIAKRRGLIDHDDPRMGSGNLDAILGFTMPHSPLNQNDSIAATKAWDKMKSGYMNRSQFTPEYNKKEYDREKNEFYYNIEKKKMRLIPTDDGEVQDVGFKSNLKKWQLPPLDRKSPLNQNEKVYNMTPNVSEKEAAGVREKFDRTYMKRGSHAHADSEFEKATYQLMNEGVIKETDNKSMPLIEKRMKENRRNK